MVNKFKKDRYVPISKNILQLLRIYWKEYKTKEYLFSGQNNPKYSTESCEKIYKKYIDKFRQNESKRTFSKY